MLSPSEGQVLKGRIELRQRLGIGGMGIVFAAYDRHLERQVAIKFVRPDYLFEPGALDAFRRESLTVAQLQHPHILTVFDMDEEEIDGERTPYLVMEYAAGGTLAQRLSVGPLDPDYARRVFEEICAALAYAHAQNVIHLDLKPANIFFDHAGQVLVGDFGLSRLLQDVTRVKAETGRGSQLYMPPEQSLGAEIGRFSDIYALGMLLYETLTGTLPRRTWEHDGLVVHLDHPLPPGVADLIRRATQSDPAARFPTIPAMLAAWTTAVQPSTAEVPAIAPQPHSEHATVTTNDPLDTVNSVIQERLQAAGKSTATVMEVAGWLDQAGVLRDNPAKRGKPLRDLVRSGRIIGRRQDSRGHWFVDRVLDTIPHKNRKR